MPLDMAFVRSQFPALASGTAFFDNAGGSQTLHSVVDRIGDYLLTTNVQTGASYAVSRASVERVRQAREAFALFVNAQERDEIIMGPSSTILMRFVSEAMTSRLGEGDEIILTNFDHEANIAPWLWHERRGVKVKWWRCDPSTFEADLAALAGLLTERTRLVAVTHASNLLGTINPIRAIADMVHEAGAELAVDAVAYAPHRAIDVQALDADYYFFSAYKVFGPHFAVMYGKKDKLLALDNIYHAFFGKESLPMKLEPGNINYELAYGAAAAVDYVRELGRRSGANGANGASGANDTPRGELVAGFDAITEQETLLAERLLAHLEARGDVRVIGRATADPAERVSTVSFVVDGVRSERIVEVADGHQLGIRFGDFYSRRLVAEHGLDAAGGVVRVSMVHYNTLEEVDRLLSALDAALGQSGLGRNGP